jgi:hypothetical protein
MHASLYYTPKVLQVGEFKEAFERAVAAVLGPDFKITVKHSRHAAEGVENEIQLDAESLRPVVDLGNIDLFLAAVTKAWDTIHVQCSTYYESFSMIAMDEKSVQCVERFALNLGLERTKRPKEGSVRAFEDIESRLAVLEGAIAAAEKRLRCFVSFKFDDAQTTAQVERLKRLLSALRIEWVTGEQFEPRRIEDKVKARLRADIDFVIAVISKAGESKWIRDELGDANARGLWIVVLLQNGATFDKGIFGTWSIYPTIWRSTRRSLPCWRASTSSKQSSPRRSDINRRQRTDRHRNSPVRAPRDVPHSNVRRSYTFCYGSASDA